MKHLFLSIILFCFNFGYTQCGYIKIETQKEVDEASKRYSNCLSVEFLDIRNDLGNINNIDSLYFIKEIQRLRLIDSYDRLENIKSIVQLKKGSYFIMTVGKNYPPFQMLDTIGHIIYRSLNNNVDLSVYKSLKYVNDAIVLFGNVKISGLQKFTTSPYFYIGVIDNKVNNSLNNIISSTGIKNLSLGIARVNSLSSKGLERVEKITNLSIIDVNSCDFKELYNIPLMDTLTMWGMRKPLDYQQGFVNVKTLKRLELDTIEVGGDLVSLLPALEYVEDYITITNSSDIRNLDFLSRCRVSIPPPSKDPEPYLVVRNNPNLISCVNPFICNLLRTQPNRVILENNGAGCDKATILASCLTSTKDTDDKDITYAYPNPFDQELIIPSSAHSSLMAIYNTAGQHMELDYLDKDRLDTSRWPSGMYIVQYLHENVMSYRKIVKQ